MNAKDMLDLVRDNINEDVGAHWDDLNILRRINLAQHKAERLFAQTAGHWLTKRATVTPVAGVITLPSDCAKPLYLEEVTNGVPINWLPSVSYRSMSRNTNLADYDQREAYPLASTIEVNNSTYTTSCYLWYQQVVPDLHAGIADTGTGANALVFAEDRALRFKDDYYNNVTVEVIDQTSEIVDISSVISDFVASTRVATITGTAAAGDTYATVSILPEESFDFIIAQATIDCLMKPSSVIDKDILVYFRDERNRTRTELEDWIATRIPEQNNMAFGDVY